MKLDKNPTLTRGKRPKSPKRARRATWLTMLTNVLPAGMGNAAKQGAADLPSAARNLVSN